MKEWERLDKEAEGFAAKLTAKEANAPSASWKLLTRSAAEPVLWLGLTGKGAAIQNKYKNFFSVWPEARQKVPTALMLEMRITPEIERYPELLQELFFQTMDNKLNDEAALRAFLEPYSPPAPPPPVNLRNPRAAKKKSAKKEEAARQRRHAGDGSRRRWAKESRLHRRRPRKRSSTKKPEIKPEAKAPQKPAAAKTVAAKPLFRQKLCCEGGEAGSEGEAGSACEEGCPREEGCAAKKAAAKAAPKKVAAKK